MQYSYYSPFMDTEGNPIHLGRLRLEDLSQLKEREIDEGAFIEYKSELSSSVKNHIPKYVTSLANERGGWIFIGIDEKTKELRPIDRGEYELQIHNILKDNTSPVPYVQVKFLPLKDKAEQGVLVIWVPEGEQPPYITHGKLYRRIGSGSSPIKEIDDRYYLDKLYQKSEKFKESIDSFCNKDISLINPNHIQGMINIYIIPRVNLDLIRDKMPRELRDYVLSRASETQTYARGDLSISVGAIFKSATYTFGSLVFRNTNKLDEFQNTLAWEQFYDGRAKFHLPVEYLDRVKNNPYRVFQGCVQNYVDPNVFYNYLYVNGFPVIAALIGCLGLYYTCMLELNPSFEEAIVVVELENIQNHVLCFESKRFISHLTESGLPFSERERYKINQKYVYSEVSTDLVSIVSKIAAVFTAFGYSPEDAALMFLEQVNDKINVFDTNQ